MISLGPTPGETLLPRTAVDRTRRRFQITCAQGEIEYCTIELLGTDSEEASRRAVRLQHEDQLQDWRPGDRTEKIPPVEIRTIGMCAKNEVDAFESAAHRSKHGPPCKKPDKCAKHGGQSVETLDFRPPVDKTSVRITPPSL